MSIEFINEFKGAKPGDKICYLGLINHTCEDCHCRGFGFIIFGFGIVIWI